MRIVADESVEAFLCRALRVVGFEVWAVVEHASGSPDLKVLEFARDREAILLTADKDFGDLIFQGLERVQGVILLRLQGLRPDDVKMRCLQAVEEHRQRLVGSFLVVTPQQVRIRVLPR